MSNLMHIVLPNLPCVLSLCFYNDSIPPVFFLIHLLPNPLDKLIPLKTWRLSDALIWRLSRKAGHLKPTPPYHKLIISGSFGLESLEKAGFIK